ncbi:MAG: MFS domain-containing protein [Nitrospira sp.]|nr:MAG: MFS domain-containing protein [Nitrospira sp.]
MTTCRAPSARTLRALDYLNVFLADVRDGVGPYLAIYLLATQHWDPASIGIAMSAMGIATVVAQTPCGALIDALTQKRLLIAIAAALVGISCAAITLFPTFAFIMTAQALNGIAAAIFPPAVAAITLGIVGPKQFAARMGRNEAFNHAGNVGAAALAGLAGYFLGREWIFYLVAAIAGASIVSIFFIAEEDIDHDVARAAMPNHTGRRGTASGLKALLAHREILIFAISVTLFHFANAAMLPLAGQLLSQDKTTGASLYMSACIIAAQLVMIPVAALAGTQADTWGRKPIFLIGFGVLPIRGCLYTLSDDPFFIIAVQLLDGIGAGIFGVLWVTVVADLTKGTGRYNLTLGTVATAQSIGAALSNAVAGYVVNAWGYNAGFLMLAGIAACALTIFYWAMPETREPEVEPEGRLSPAVYPMP